MRAGFVVATMILGAMSAAAQDAPEYRSSDNPFQEDLPYSVGQPIVLQVDVQGVRFGSITIVPRGEVQAGVTVQCDASLNGSNQRAGKIEVAVVLLLEDSQGKGTERVQLEPFKVKAGRDFNAASRVSIQGDSLRAARRVYVYIEVID